MPDPTPQNTFVVRFWWEMGGTEMNRPRQRGDSIAFADAREMLAFLERFVAPLERQLARDKEDA